MSNLERYCETENRKNRNVGTVTRRWKMSDYLQKQVSSYENLLIHGMGPDRKSTMEFWLRQLFEDEDTRNRPVIVISRDKAPGEALMKDLEKEKLPICRPFLMTSAVMPNYNMFLEWPADQIQDAIQNVAKYHPAYTMDHWNTSLLQKACQLLNQYGYAVSLDNLYRIFSQEPLTAADQLEQAGAHNEAVEIRKDQTSFRKMNEIFCSLKGKFQFLSKNGSEEDYGHGLYELVMRKQRDHKAMPFLYLVPGDKGCMEFLECLTEEIRAISRFKPILVIDSVSIDQSKDQTSAFYKYIQNSGEISLTLTAEDCTSIIPEEGIREIFGKYHFQMILINGTNTVENLTAVEVGTYTYLSHGMHDGVDREFLNPLPRGRHKGGGITEVPNRPRISGEDMRRLKNHECYICRGEQAELYRNMYFDR